MKIITFNKENECEKQDGLSPDSIIYAGPIKDVTDDILQTYGLSYSKFSEAIKKASKGEDFCLIVRAVNIKTSREQCELGETYYTKEVESIWDFDTTKFSSFRCHKWIGRELITYIIRKHLKTESGSRFCVVKKDEITNEIKEALLGEIIK